MKFDTGQWSVLRDTFDASSSHISPFVRNILNSYFKTHTVNDRIVETAEELDALISLCGIVKQRKSCYDSCKGDDAERTVEAKSILACNDEQYIRLMEIFELLSELREQYRLTLIRGRTNSQFERQV